MKLNYILILLILSMSLVSAAPHQLPSDLVDDDTSLMEGVGNWAYQVTQGAFWSLLLGGFCVVLFIGSVRFGVGRAFGFAGTIGIFGSLFLITVGWMSWGIASVFFIVGTIAIVFMVKDKID